MKKELVKVDFNIELFEKILNKEVEGKIDSNYLPEQDVKSIDCIITTFKYGDTKCFLIHLNSTLYPSIIITENGIPSELDTNYFNILEPLLTLFVYKIVDETEEQHKEIPPKDDIIPPFTKVLVRDFNNDAWNIDFYSYKDSTDIYYTMTGSYNQCILYEGNEHLLGTNKNIES